MRPVASHQSMNRRLANGPRTAPGRQASVYFMSHPQRDACWERSSLGVEAPGMSLETGSSGALPLDLEARRQPYKDCSPNP